MFQGNNATAHTSHTFLAYVKSFCFHGQLISEGLVQTSTNYISFYGNF